MWIFIVQYQPSGYSGSSNLIFRVLAKTWETACPKLYKALQERRILGAMGDPTLEEFEEAFDSDYSVFGSVEIHSVHPDDDHYVR